MQASPFAHYIVLTALALSFFSAIFESSQAGAFPQPATSARNSILSISMAAAHPAIPKATSPRTRLKLVLSFSAEVRIVAEEAESDLHLNLS